MVRNIISSCLNLHLSRIQKYIDKVNNYDVEADIYENLIGQYDDILFIQNIVKIYGEKQLEEFQETFSKYAIEYFKLKFPLEIDLISRTESNELFIDVYQNSSLIITINLYKKTYEIISFLKNKDENYKKIETEIVELKNQERIEVNKLDIYNFKLRNINSRTDLNTVIKNIPIIKKKNKKEDIKKIYEIQQAISDKSSMLIDLKVEIEIARKKDLFVQSNRNLISNILNSLYYQNK